MRRQVILDDPPQRPVPIPVRADAGRSTLLAAKCRKLFPHESITTRWVTVGLDEAVRE